LAGSGSSFLLVLALAAGIYVCLFGHLGAMGLVGPDEPRYASIARAMAETHDWVTPRLNGQPWFEKPVLYYWAAGMAFRLFGVSEFAARFPSALGAVFATLALAWAALRFHGRGPALLTLLLMPTTLGMFAFARAATPDMLFAAALAGTMATAAALLWLGEIPARHRVAIRVAFGALLGAATLAKGPAALVLAGGSVLLWAIASRRWPEALRLFDPLAILTFCLVALPWYVVCALRNPGFLRVFLLAHNFERYLTPVFHHEQPFWFFVPILALALLPWTALLVLLARDSIQTWRTPTALASPALFFACWTIFPFLFFSFSKSKLPGYILPALPPLVLLLARSISCLLYEKGLLARVCLGAVGGAFMALSLAASYGGKRLPAETLFVAPRPVNFLLVAAGTAGLVIALLGALGKVRAALLASVLTMAALVEGVSLFALPALDHFLSPRAAAEGGVQLTASPADLTTFRLSRAWKYGLDFYFHRELQEWTPQAPRPCWVYTSDAGVVELEQEGFSMATAVNFGSTEGWLVLLAGAEHAPSPSPGR
jgi:4-amino-4-deoxy-L-arabinose transferase-like glycosyltransferase